MASTSSRVRALMGLTPPKRRYCSATCSSRAGGMLRPAVTRSRNGRTSSMPSGPPKDTIRSASMARTPAADAGWPSASAGPGRLDLLPGALLAEVPLRTVAQNRDHLLLHHRRAAFGALHLDTPLRSCCTSHGAKP